MSVESPEYEVLSQNGAFELRRYAGYLHVYEDDSEDDGEATPTTPPDSARLRFSSVC